MSPSDVDECSDPDLYSCHDDSHCVNTYGNYTCQCDDGFTDLGELCQGKNQTVNKGFTCEEGLCVGKKLLGHL